MTFWQTIDRTRLYNTICVYIYPYLLVFKYSIYYIYTNHIGIILAALPFPLRRSTSFRAPRLGALVLCQGQGIGGGSPAHHVHHLLALEPGQLDLVGFSGAENRKLKVLS